MKRLAAVSLTAVLAASPAFAQSPPAPATTAGPGDLIVVTASRSGAAVPVEQLGASVTVLDDEALEQRQTRIVSDILRDVPGAAVSRLGAVGSMTQVRLRGTEANHLLVLIDGIEAADPYQGEYDFATLIAVPETRIEVLRGQQSSLYGSDAIGGVIHAITLTGAESPGFHLRGEGGSHGTISGAARAAGVAGALDYALSAAYHHTDGYPTARNGTRDLGSDHLVVSGKATWTLSDTLALTAVGRFSDTEADTNNQFFDDGTSPLLGLVVDSPLTYYESRAVYGLLSGRYTSSDGSLTAALTAQIGDFRSDTFSLGAQSGGSDGQRLKGSFETSYRLDTGSVRHRLTIAVDAEREKFRNRLGAFGAFAGQLETDNLGLVAQYELLAGERVSLGASLRHDFNDRFEDATTYRLQGSYALPTGTRLRAAYGTGIKNPTYFELFGATERYIGNPGLQPETSEGWEIGVEQSFVGGKAVIGATYFDSTLDDEIFTVFGFPSTTDNRSSSSRQKGVEVFLAARPIPQIRVDASYTYLDAEEDGAVEVRRPRHIGSVNTTVSSPDQRLSATLTLRYNGRQRDNAFVVPPFGAPLAVELRDYALVNLAAAYALTDAIEVFGRVENLLDQDYEEVFSFVGPGRTAYAGVRTRF